jgi:hemerythrin-like domain-containing protein
MTATKNLENDHVYILRLTDVMERMILKGNTEIEHLEKAVKLIREYADGFHHAKEESLLFPLMETKGFSSKMGPVAVMLHEHVMGRDFVKGMLEGIQELKDGNASAYFSIYENMKGYIELLRNHISKENNILFRMADNAISDEEQQDLLGKFSEIEKALPGGIGAAVFTGGVESLEAVFR